MLAHGSMRDPLTGTASLALLAEVSRQLLALARRYGRHAAFLHLEVGGFDAALDGLDSAEHKLLVTRAAARIRRAVRDSDAVARVGPDAFLVLLSDLWEPEATVRVADRLYQALTGGIRVGRKNLRFPVRMGVALFPQDGDHAESLALQAADAMARVERGTSGIEFHNVGIGEELRGRLGMETDLRRDVSEGQFKLAFQPIFTLADGAVCGAEALCRWSHRERGTLPAAEFVKLAEQTGRIRTLDHFAVDTAVAQAKRWVSSGWHGWVSVNLSAHSLSDPRLPAGIAATLEQNRLHPQHLVVEITESAAMREPRLAARTLSQLRDMGVAVAVDDFGTGYSSFSYLHAFQVDLLKLDRSFVVALAEDPRHGRVLEGLIQMSHHLEKPVVAEGIEEDSHREWLAAAECDMVQGFLFGRPMPPQEFEGRFLHAPTDPDAELPPARV